MSRASFLPRAGLFAAALSAVLFGSSPVYATDLPVVGDHGDASVRDVCPSGGFMVGLQVSSGDWMDKLSVICASVGKDGATGNHTAMPQAYGGPGGGPQPPFNCASGAVVSGIGVSFTPNGQVRYFTLNCRAENNGAISSSSRIGPAGNPTHDQACPLGELATGMIVNYGKAVNGIGLICAANPKTALVSGDQSLEAACRTYASNAVAEYYQFTGRGCSIGNETNRWSSVYPGHYAWCVSQGLGSPRPNQEDAERKKEAGSCLNRAAVPISAVQRCATDCGACSPQKCSFPDQHCTTYAAPAACY